MSPVVAFQGEPGAFSDEAARRLVPGAATRGYATFAELVGAVDSASAELGLLPVENSIYGAIAASYDLLWAHPGLTIVDEIAFRVVQNLIGAPGASIATIREVRSHPVALEQVRRFLGAHGDWTITPWLDTALAVADVVAAGDPGIAAIGSSYAAELYGASILAAGIEDDADNITRFYLLEHGGVGRRALGRACVAFELADKPGALRDALAAFADRGINLRSLVSRPNREQAFAYRFYCEVTDVDTPRLQEALTTIGDRVRIFGIY